MKRRTIAMLTIAAMCSCTSRDYNERYVKEDFITCTNLKDSYTVINSRFYANQAVTLATVSEKDKERLLRRYQYFPVDSLRFKKAGYVSIYLYKFTDEYVYHLADYEVQGRPAQHAYKKDGYYILGVSKTKNEIVFCENFPELPPF